MATSSRTSKHLPQSHSSLPSVQLQTRAFAPPGHQSSPLEQTPQVQLAAAERLGHHFGQIEVAAPGRESTPNRPLVQFKMTIGAVGDPFEREADRVAASVVDQINQSQAETVQRMDAPEEDEVQMKPIASLQRLASPEEDEVQMKSLVQRQSILDGGPASEELETTIQQAKGSGQPLGEPIRRSMEQAFNADFSGVRVHANSSSEQLNRSLSARAFTTGQDIFFKQGEYNPSNRNGQELLAHELTHVVQQNGATVQRRR